MSTGLWWNGLLRLPVDVRQSLKGSVKAMIVVVLGLAPPLGLTRGEAAILLESLLIGKKSSPRRYKFQRSSIIQQVAIVAIVASMYKNFA